MTDINYTEFLYKALDAVMDAPEADRTHLIKTLLQDETIKAAIIARPETALYRFRDMIKTAPKADRTDLIKTLLQDETIKAAIIAKPACAFDCLKGMIKAAPAESQADLIKKTLHTIPILQECALAVLTDTTEHFTTEILAAAFGQAAADKIATTSIVFEHAGQAYAITPESPFSERPTIIFNSVATTGTKQPTVHVRTGCTGNITPEQLAEKSAKSHANDTTSRKHYKTITDIVVPAFKLVATKTLPTFADVLMGPGLPAAQTAYAALAAPRAGI